MRSPPRLSKNGASRVKDRVAGQRREPFSLPPAGLAGFVVAALFTLYWLYGAFQDSSHRIEQSYHSSRKSRDIPVSYTHLTLPTIA